MKHIIFFFCLMALQPVYAIDRMTKFNFDSVSVSQVINLVYADSLKQPFVISPEVLQDKRTISFRFDRSEKDFKYFWVNFLDSLGFSLQTKNGVDFVSVKKEGALVAPDLYTFVYKPRYRSVAYLVDVTSGLFSQGAFSIQRSVTPALNEPSPVNSPKASASAQIGVGADILVFEGSATDLKKFKSVLPQIDIPTNEVIVNAVIYEVNTSDSSQTSFSLALKLFGQSLGVTINNGSTTSNSIGLSGTNFQAAFTALSGDSRFKAVSTSHLRIQSGNKASLQVGQDVPTLGAITYAQNGSAAAQSIDYRSSGMIFDLLPTVHDKNIDLVVNQQISDFSKTETGVNNSPTLTKRSLSTTVSMDDGELILIGGLTQDKSTNLTSGLSFLPTFMRGKNRADSKSDILLLMQVTKINNRLEK